MRDLGGVSVRDEVEELLEDEEDGGFVAGVFLGDVGGC